MDESTATSPDLLNELDTSTLADISEHGDEEMPPAGSAAEPAKKSRGLRRGFLKAASLQDKMLEKLIAQMMPFDPGQAQGEDRRDAPVFAERPSFTVTAMSNNFRRFNARIGAVFKFQARAIRLLSWRRPTQTLAFLAVYTFVCLNPYLLAVLPPAIVLFGILVPSFVARHLEAPASLSSDDVQARARGPVHASSSSSSSSSPSHAYHYSPRGPPLASARTARPVQELSRDFFANMRDLQNSMDDYSIAHDTILGLVVPATDFSDEARSSALFVLLVAVAVAMSLAAHLLPWRFLALAAGWAAVCSAHPVAARWIHTRSTGVRAKDTDSKKKNRPVPSAAHGPSAALTAALDELARRDIVLDAAPETREVEMFELQRRLHPSADWEAWVFSPSPYDPLAPARLAGDRPAGARFFEDVLPPPGWAWSEKKWALDLWSREWVEERIITGVEVETEGERWVYDMFTQHDVTSGVVDGPRECVGDGTGGARGRSSVAWEESEEGLGRRGEWRRRRWVRMVKRKNVD